MTLVDDLRRRQLLQQIPVDAERVALLLDDADRHLRSALVTLDAGDLSGA